MSCPLRHILLLILVPLLAAYGLWSCSPSAERIRLEAADAIMEQNPDSAYAIVCAIDTSALRSAGDRALYALLYTQARTKLNYVQTDDSLIATAVRYYERRGDSPELMRALFYRGDVTYNDGDMHTALLSTIRARAIAIDQGDHYWRAKCAEQLADIYSSAYESKLWKEYFGEAAEYYAISGNRRNHLFSLCDYAGGCYMLGDTLRGIQIRDSVLAIARAEKDSLLIGYALRGLLYDYYNTNDFYKAAECWDKLQQVSHIYRIDARNYAYKAAIETSLCNYDAAAGYLHYADSAKITSADSVSIFWPKYHYYLKLGKKDDAIQVLVDYLTFLDRKLERIGRNPIAGIHRDYNNLLYEKAVYEKDNIVRYSILFSVLGAIILIATVIIIRQKIRMKNLEIEQYMSRLKTLSESNAMGRMEYESLKKDMSGKDEIIYGLEQAISHKDSEIADKASQYRDIIDSLFKERWVTINNLCREFFEHEKTEIQRKMVYQEVVRSINKLSTPKMLSHLERIVNLYRDNLLERLRRQCPFLSDLDIKVATYLFAGFEIRTIGVICDIKRNSLYARRLRIIEHIAKVNPVDCEEFIRYLRQDSGHN